MNSKLWIQKALSSCLVVAIIATYSMVALGNTTKAAGELLVTGKNIDGVTVNGESAKTGRSVFSASTIATTENAGAIINLGTVGKIELAPNTVLTVNFNDKGITGNLASGRVTVLGAASTVGITTVDGTMNLTAGESATAAGKDDDKSKKADTGGAAWWIWGAIFAGAAVGVIYAATVGNDNSIQLGGSTTVASPNR